MTTVPLIGICGFSRSGKDTVARLLAEQYRIGLVAFADPLKREVAAAWQVDTSVFYGDEKDRSIEELALRRCTDSEFVAEHWHLAGLSTLKPRTVMQCWGKWMHHRDPGRYVRLAAQTVAEIASTDPAAVLITDARLDHERDWLRSQGGLIWRVVNPARPHPPSGDATEKQHLAWRVDAVIMNDGKTEQLAKVAVDLFRDVCVPGMRRRING